MTRTNARRLAVQLVFAAAGGSDFTAEEYFEKEFYKDFDAEDGLSTETPDEKEKSYICSIVNGVQDYVNELDAVIERYAVGWSLRRISKASLAILRCAVYELLYMPADDVPPAVAINEAVELAKTFDEVETAAFVNGILGSFVRAELGVEPASAPEAET